jgi:molybdopterin-containing oxidoreductase family iron-sulfur binding subunit
MAAAQVALESKNRRSEGYTIALHPTVGMLDGSHAYNPWLHELPDPIAKVTWDNFAAFSPAAASSLGLQDGDVVRIEAGAVIELPVVVQPAQHDSVISIALGYGRKASERFAQLGPRWINARSSVNEDGRIGKNATPLLRLNDGLLRYERAGAKITRTGRRIELAATQIHHTVSVPAHLAPAGSAVRPIVQETTLRQLTEPAHEHEQHEELWPDDHPYTGHRWGMAVDLNACTGCSACVIACQAENNTPVVGKDEVRRRREMHWIRIDRYYSGPPDDVEVAHQPMMCQQCDHAPCETVCPVLATVHSEEGLNQQIYNRCVGTRYCANNCPYKTRRFNWFDYPREDRLANMALNPDVTVRSRGVMEKCTFCVQRIQEAKIEAKLAGVPVKDGDIRTACEQACPANAIVFGDVNDPDSRVSRLARGDRQYRVLEELNVGPAVHYLKIVRTRGEEETRHG